MIDGLNLPAAAGTKLGFQEVVIDGVTYLISLTKVGHGADGEFNEVSNADPFPIVPYMRDGGNVEQATSGNANYAAFDAQPCRQAMIVNDTGFTILVQQDGAGVGIPIRDGLALSFLGISDLSQLGVKRKDGGAAVNVQVRWEG